MHIPGFGPRTAIDQDRHIVTLEDHTGLHDPPLSTHNQGEPAQRPLGLQPAPVGLCARVDAETAIDLLCENQRGAFLCGSPLFSAVGLWVTDPRAWTSPTGGYTPFDITNATLPDPTWEWIWPRWFVDMAGDVDENGWMYNLNFTKHHWHGHHLWYHSFVRRRYWLRKRRKRSSTAAATGAGGMRRMEESQTGYTATVLSHGNTAFAPGRVDDADDAAFDANQPLDNLGEFRLRLREARLDREKLEAVDNYLHHGKDLYALSGEIKTILRFMVFQESRRRLLALLARHCQELERAHAGHAHDYNAVNQDEGEEAERKTRQACVADAVDMAQILIAKLDYWSDQQLLTRIEEDAELERLRAVKLDEQAKRRGVPDLEKLHQDEAEEGG